MDDKLWNYGLSVGGTTGFLVVVLIVAWKTGLLNWFTTTIAGRTSNEAIIKTYNDVNADIIKRLTTEITTLKNEVTEIKEKHKKEINDHEKELEEKQQIIKGLRAEYDFIDSQLREIQRRLPVNEASLIHEILDCRKQILALKIDLTKANKEIDQYKRTNTDYTPISGD